MLVVEVGSTSGAHTVDLARLVGPDGQVHALEPRRIVFQALCANVALNQCTNVFARHIAVCASNGSIDVPAVDPGVRMHFGGLSRVANAGGERVPLVTLDSHCIAASHFLLADDEGMEVLVLPGAHSL